MGRGRGGWRELWWWLLVVVEVAFGRAVEVVVVEGPRSLPGQPHVVYSFILPLFLLLLFLFPLTLFFPLSLSRSVFSLLELSHSLFLSLFIYIFNKFY